MKKLFLYVLLSVPIIVFGQTKISDMPAATTPTGTELVPIVQGGYNKKATIDQINSGYIKTANFYTIGDGRWLKLPALPGIGQDGQSLRWNNGTGLWEYFTASAGNLTGAITSSGLATSLGSFTSNALGTAISDPVRTVTGTDAIVQADNGRTIYFNSATPFNFTIDALTINTFTMFRNIGTATVSFVDGSGVTSTGATALLAGEVGGVEYIASTTPIISVVGSGGGSMVYPGAGIPLSTGSAWGTSITDNSSNWNTAYGWGNHASAGYLTGLTNGNGTTVNGTGDGVDLGGATSANYNVTGIYDQQFERSEPFVVSGPGWNAIDLTRYKLQSGGFKIDASLSNDGGAFGTRTAKLELVNDLNVSSTSAYYQWLMNSVDPVTGRTTSFELDPYYFRIKGGSAAHSFLNFDFGNSIFSFKRESDNNGFYFTNSGVWFGESSFVNAKFGYDATGSVINLGSDASQDLYKRNGSGYFTRIPVGSNGDVLTVTAGSVGWAAPSGGGGGLTVGTSTITSGTNTKVLYNNSGVLGEYTVSGSGNVAMTTSPVFTTPNIGTATGTASGNYSLASGGTATGTNTFAMGSNPFILTSGVTTGTGATAGIRNVFNSLTTGNGLDASSSSYSSGAIVKITGTGTAAASNTQRALWVDVSGANSTSAQTTYGGYFSNVRTGTTSVNIGVYGAASGATTNYAGHFAGTVNIVGAGTTSATNSLLVKDVSNNGLFSVRDDGNTFILSGSGTAAALNFGASGLYISRSLSGTNGLAIITPATTTFDNGSGLSVSNGTFTTGTKESSSYTATGSYSPSSGTSDRSEFKAISYMNASSTNTSTVHVFHNKQTVNSVLGNYIGFDHVPTITSITGSHFSFRGVTGSAVFGSSTLGSSTTRLQVNGIDDTTGKIVSFNNNSGTERLSIEGNGEILFSGSGGTSGQVLTSGGSNAPPTWEEGIRTVKVTLSSAELLNSFSAAKQLIAAPGAGKVNEVISITMRYNYLTAPYVTNTTLAVYYSTVEVAAHTGVLDQLASVIKVASPGIGFVSASADLENQAVFIGTKTGNPTAGSGTLDVYVTYRIITL
jgi:hypothetical protein